MSSACPVYVREDQTFQAPAQTRQYTIPIIRATQQLTDEETFQKYFLDYEKDQEVFLGLEMFHLVRNTLPSRYIICLNLVVGHSESNSLALLLRQIIL